MVSVNKTDFVVVAGVEYETKAQFFWLSIIDEFREKPGPKIQIFSGMSKVALVPNVTEAHQGVVFKCAMTTNSTTEMKCVNSGKNLHSYVVKYTLDLRSSTYDFVTSSKVEAVLYNVVNLQPTAVSFERDFVAFRAKNQLPLKADEEIQHNKFFRDSHVFLVYKLNKYIVKYGNPDQIYTADVYKIYEAADFEAETGADLSKVRPRFFTDSAGQLKLAFNLGKKSHSLHIYNLDGITMSLTESQAGKMDYRFSAKGLSGKEYEFRASQIFNYSTAGRNKTVWIIVIITSCVLLVAVIVFGFVKYRHADGLDDRDYDLALGNGDLSKSIDGGVDSTVNNDEAARV